MRKYIALFFLSALVLAPIAAQSDALGPPEFYWLMDRACVSGDDLSVEMLLKAGADPTGVRDYEAFLAKYQKPYEPSLHLAQAAYGGHLSVVRLLIGAGADPNVAQGEGETALTIAAKKGHLKIVSALLAAGANRGYETPYGTALQLAEKNGHTKVAEMLRDQR